MTTEIIKKYFSDLAKQSHKKKPRSKEFYRMMGKKSAEARKKKTVDNSSLT